MAVVNLKPRPPLTDASPRNPQHRVARLSAIFCVDRIEPSAAWQTLINAFPPRPEEGGSSQRPAPLRSGAFLCPASRMAANAGATLLPFIPLAPGLSICWGARASASARRQAGNAAPLARTFRSAEIDYSFGRSGLSTKL